MKLSQLPKIVLRSKKRLGRGYGSGKGGHTVGRGAKGDKARGTTVLGFTGTKIKKSFLKRLPLRRGKGKFKSLKTKPLIVNLKYLNLFPKGSEINLEALIKKGIVDFREAKATGVKILGEGDLKVALKVQLPCSKGAIDKINKAGGEVISVKEKPTPNLEGRIGSKVNKKSKLRSKSKLVKK